MEGWWPGSLGGLEAWRHGRPKGLGGLEAFVARKFRGFGGLEGLEASEAWRSRGPEALKDWWTLGLEDMEVFEALHD